MATNGLVGRVNELSKIDIIQGGMGVGVSHPGLANACSREGMLGVVSGIESEVQMIRRLQNGDADGKIREALSKFPDQKFADWIVSSYFVEGGIDPKDRYAHKVFTSPFVDSNKVMTFSNTDLEKMLVASNFVDITLAKEGHDNPVGLNLLYKVKWPLMPSLYGAMLAGVDAVCIGAGIGKDIPSILDTLSIHGAFEACMRDYVFDIKGNKLDYKIRFDPSIVTGVSGDELMRPVFVGVVGNHLGLKFLPNADAYVLEGPKAGGHNAPARSKDLNDLGEPVYGEKDEIDFGKLEHLRLKNAETKGYEQPFWLAGSYAGRLAEAKELGAAGVQAGTVFAFCSDSGIEPTYRREMLLSVLNGTDIITDPNASPSGFPFKCLDDPSTVYHDDNYYDRKRSCDFRYLADFVEMPDGQLKMRCAAEPVKSYVAKGGDADHARGKVCLCNGLLATTGLGSRGELPLVTVGSDVKALHQIVDRFGLDYTAKDVKSYIMGK